MLSWTFLVYVASFGRPPHELLNPNPIGIETTFRAEFESMTVEPVSLSELLDAREQWFTEVRQRLDSTAKALLLSPHDGAADFKVIGLPQAENLPAIKRKLLNLRRRRERNADKHAKQRTAIEELF